jgi:hypothetical protein
VALPLEHVPAVAPPPEPHDPLSQSAPLWQTCAAPLPQVPFVVPPQLLLSQSVFL